MPSTSRAACIILFFLILAEVSSISLLDAYRSDRAVRKRQGQANVRFRPVMHLRGEDDWRTQLGHETLTDQMMDENGIVYDLNPTSNDRITTFFNSYNPHQRLG